MTAPDQIADFLLDHRRSQVPVDRLPDSLYPDSIKTAYEAQDRVVDHLTRHHNSATCGYKMACTNAEVIRHLNVSGTFPGQLMTHSTHDSGTRLDPGLFRLRIMEAEFGFILGQDVPMDGPSWDAESIRPFIEAFVPSLEIVDHRFNDFTLAGEHALIADNAIHGACIFGEPVTAWHAIDFIQWPVRMLVNGETVTEGCGRNVLGNPLHAMAWLANHLNSRGRSLHAGERVSTGTAGRIHYAVPGDAVVVDFGSLGQVSCVFTR